jgi:hypothetical protein
VARNDLRPDPEEQKAAREQFQATVRNAKRAYWRHIIDDIKDDKDLYKIMAWHKLTPNLKAPPLIVDGRSIEDTLEKAEALRASVLGCFNNVDDLPEDPLENWTGSGHLPWDPSVSLEEVEKNTIGVTSTSPGTDRITVRLLKACWAYLREPLHGLYNRCLPSPFSHALGGWRKWPYYRKWARKISPLSALGAQLPSSLAFPKASNEFARRLAWTAIACGVISPQHGGALPKRSTMDLVAAFTHDVEAALAQGRKVTMVTMDVQGALDALLRRRLLKRMMEHGFPLALIHLIESFLSDRSIRVRLEKTTTSS